MSMVSVSSTDRPLEGGVSLERARRFSAARTDPTPVTPELEDALAATTAAARVAWPALKMEETEFIEHLARLTPLDAEGASAALANVHAGDLFLAWSAGRGDRAALAAFDACHFALLPADSRQEIFDHLFKGEPQDRKILRYAGRAPLARWISVVRRNVKLSQVRADCRTVSAADGVLERLTAVGPSPELELVKRKYKVEVEEALRAALTRLRPRDRRVLDLVTVNRVSLARVGRLFGVDASTVWHWMNKIRTQLREDIEEHLRARNIAVTDLASIVRLLRSQIDISLAGSAQPSR